MSESSSKCLREKAARGLVLESRATSFLPFRGERGADQAVEYSVRLVLDRRGIERMFGIAVGFDDAAPQHLATGFDLDLGRPVPRIEFLQRRVGDDSELGGKFRQRRI